MSNGGQYRSSLFVGLLLILLGVIFFIDRLYPGFEIGRLISIYWPVLLILWGIAKLLDRLSARGAGQARPAILSGGEGVLLVLLALVLSGFVFRDWLRNHFPGLALDLAPFQQSYSQSIPLAPQTLAPGARVAIATGRGDVTVHASDDDKLVVTARKSGPGSNESSADERMKQVAVAIDRQGDGVLVHPVHMDTVPGGASVDFDVRVPKGSSLAIDAAHGDVNVSGVAGNIDVRAGDGDTDIQGAGADVSVESDSGDVRVSGVGGNVRLSGRGDDVEINQVAGNASIEGAFAGDVELRNVAKTLRCTTQFSDVTLSQLTGKMDLDSDDISVSGVGGDARIVTRNKGVTADHISGQLSIVDSHSDVDVSYDAPPRADISITDDSGDVDLKLPSNSNFFLSAISRSGEVNSDFGGPALRPVNDENTQQLNGQFGSGGPKISISNTYGTVRLSKSP
ncbi:MAG TPA: DUF4097 family beta strand repeat-containing protein [Candidatus Baltobacteraceae bacterium]|nr:DUF4097 family beta strand repeat-containing protein [Candidatus Baltobacteraceae bacterium]